LISHAPYPRSAAKLCDQAGGCGHDGYGRFRDHVAHNLPLHVLAQRECLYFPQHPAPTPQHFYHKQLLSLNILSF